MSDNADSGAAVADEVHARPLATERGWEWIAKGWVLFVAAPWIWVLCILIFVCLFFVATIIPFAAGVLGVILSAGLLFACGELSAKRPFNVTYLFAGFQRETGSLVVVGLIYAVAKWLVGFLTFAVAGAAISATALSAMLMKGDIMGAFAMILGLGISALLAALVYLGLSVPVAMAIWFAPALVVFDKMKPLDALRASFDGCLKNMLPFLLWGVVMMVLFFVGSIPAALGLLVVFPLMVTSTYIAYREIFQGES